ncbi:hypothetical protein Tco_1044548 [Tanacetum coccineum]|uniref:Uncharacterized protein n=1 Tax=Tanacetum coccineum TaxID=301880 RepID=A0ABQ5GQL4_9ASTR
MENVNPSSTLGSSSQEPSVTTHAKFTARINKLLQMRQTIDSLLFKTMNELTNQSSDSEIFCPEERIKELELRTQRRNNFEEELFKDRLYLMRRSLEVLRKFHWRLSGLSWVTGSSLGIIKGHEGTCDDDSAIFGY